MIKSVLKRTIIVLLISTVSIVGFQLYRVHKIKQYHQKIYNRLDPYLEQVVIPNTVNYPPNLESVIYSIDDALECIMNPDGTFYTHGSDMPTACLLIMSSDASKLGDRLGTLYKSAPDTYYFLAQQFPLNDKYWFTDYFINKSTTEVLLELSVLKQQLIISYLYSK